MGVKLINMHRKPSSIIRSYINYICFYNIISAKNIFILFSFLLSISTNVIAQSDIMRFNHLTTDDGLSQSTIYCILKSSDGFMWFGTADGLNKYDGYEFVIYKNNQDDSLSISGNKIITAYEDKNGNLWFGTTKGLSLYNKDTDNFKNFYVIDDNKELIAPDRIKVLNGPGERLWISVTGGGLGLFDLNDGFVKKYIHDDKNPNSISSSNIMDIYIDSKDRFWIATTNGLNLFNVEHETFRSWFPEPGNPKSIPGTNIRAINEDSNGNIWFSCYGGGLCKLVEKDNDYEFLRFQHKPGKNILSNKLIISTFIAKHGLWIGMQNGGLDYFNTEKFTFKNYINDIHDPASLNNNSVSSIYEEENGNLWIGTYGAGVNLTSPVMPAFKFYRNIGNIQNTLSYNYVSDIFEGKDGKIWIATDGGGLNRFDRKSSNFKHYKMENSNLPNNAALAVIEDSFGEIWVGNWKGGLNKFNKKTGQFKTYTNENSGLPTNSVFELFEDSKKRLWVNSFLDDGGLVLFNRAKGYADKVYNLKNSNILDPNFKIIKEDNNGNLILGCQRGLSIFNPENETFLNLTEETHNLSDNFIMSVLVWDDSIIWVGTSNGLNRFNQNTNEIIHFYEKDGLPNNSIKALEKDDNGYIWIATNRGISKFNPKYKTFKNFGKEDGLQANEFNIRSSLQSKDCNIWFGGVGGFNVFNPKNIITNTQIPPIVFTNFQIFNKAVPIGTENFSLLKHIDELEILTLSYKESVISFYFSALNYISPEKNEYAYIMEGFEDNWNYVGNERKATYTNLSPGSYTFRVRASNNDGIWNETGKSLKIVITPPFWKTLWFRTVFVLVLLISIYIIFKIRTYKINKRNRELANINIRLNKEIEEKHRAEKEIQELNRELERRVRERTAELQSVNQELESFSYSVSHDLRAPLRSMHGFSSAILEDYADILDEQGRGYLERIATASNTMAHLIDDLLKLAKVSRSDINKENINLSKIVEDITNQLKDTYPDRNVQVQIEENLYAKGDLNLIKVAIENLINNAWKFTSKKQSAKIEFHKTEEKFGDVFIIKDNGVGFDMEYVDKLYEPFQRLHKEYEGTGIGLATVARIIKKHGGEFWAEGKVNKGATFYFTL